MKKYFCNIRTLAALLMAGAALAACSNTDDTIIEQQPVTLAGEQVYKLTIKTLNGNDATRALILDGSGNLAAKWEVNDKLAVSKGGTSLTSNIVCTEANGDEATFSGTITGEVAVDDELTLTYHPVAISAFGNQDGTLQGTLESAENYDIAIATVTVASVDDENNITINETSADFTTQTAVMKLLLTTDGTTTINPTSLKVSAALGMMSEDIITLAIPAATYTAEYGGDGILYFALPSASSVASRIAAKFSMSESMVTTMLASAKITFTATVGSGIYTATKNGYIFAGGKYYTSTLTMERTPVDLSKQTTSYEAKDGDILTGTLNSKVKISIAEYAKVTFNNLTINGENNSNYNFAGITCEGDAEITLVGENTVKGFHEDWPGIYVPEGNTLTINGTGKLDASSNGKGAGIGAGYSFACGNIDIQGGDITATGGEFAAGIGGAHETACGDITISDGTVEAKGGIAAPGIGSGVDFTDMENVCNITIIGGTVTATGSEGGAGIGSGNTSVCGNITINDGNVKAYGGQYGAGIGGGNEGICGDIKISGGTVEAKGGESAAGIGCGLATQVCGDITITDDVTSVTATKGEGGFNCIGVDVATMQSGKVTIGDTEYWNGNGYVNDGESYLQSNSIVYPEP